jgi:LEA14-like dessication related protein
MRIFSFLNRRLLFTGLLLGGILALLSFIIPKSWMIKDAEISEIRKVEFINHTDTSMLLSVVATIRNLNKVGATLSKSEGTIYIDKYKIGKFSQVDNQKIRANDTSTLVLNVEINTAETRTWLPELLKKDSAVISVKGLYWLKFGLLPGIKLKQNNEKKIVIREELQKILRNQLAKSIKISSITPTDIKLSETTLRLNLDFKNPFPLQFTIDSIGIDLFFHADKPSIGNWHLKEPVEVPPLQTKKIEGAAIIDNRNTLTQGISVIFGNREVLAKGVAKIQFEQTQLEIPIEQIQKM